MVLFLATVYQAYADDKTSETAAEGDSLSAAGASQVESASEMAVDDTDEAKQFTLSDEERKKLDFMIELLEKYRQGLSKLLLSRKVINENGEEEIRMYPDINLTKEDVDLIYKNFQRTLHHARECNATRMLQMDNPRVH